MKSVTRRTRLLSLRLNVFRLRFSRFFQHVFNPFRLIQRFHLIFPDRVLVGDVAISIAGASSQRHQQTASDKGNYRFHKMLRSS